VFLKQDEILKLISGNPLPLMACVII